MRFDLSIAGEKQFSRELLGVRGRAQDFKPAFEKIHRSFLASERRQFDSAGSYASGGWVALRPATIARKNRLGLDPRILHATLRLRKSLTTTSHREHVFKVESDRVFLGTLVPYAGVHQNPSPNSGLPRRRPVELTENTRKSWTKILHTYLVKSRV